MNMKRRRMDPIYKRIGFVFPDKISRAFRQQLYYVGKDINERVYLGSLLVRTIVASFVLGLLAGFFLNLDSLTTIGAMLALVFLLNLIAWIMLNLTSDSQGRFVNGILPDALQLISSNIKAGLTTEKALLVSARPEFGQLEIELKRTSTKIMSGIPVEQALLEMPDRIRSKVLERTVWLIARGIAAGGEIADLLLQLSNNLRKQNSLEDEANASISIYVMLIFFSAAVGGPALYGTSSFIVEIMAAQRLEIPTLENSRLPSGSLAAQMIAGPKDAIDPEFVISYTMILLFVGTIFASVTIGIINSGKEIDGAKVFPMMLLVSFAIFFIIRLVLNGAFGELLLGN